MIVTGKVTLVPATVAAAGTERYHLRAVLPFGEFPPQEGVTSTLVTAIAEKIQQECGDKALREHNGLHLRTVVFWDSETLQSKISMDVLVGVLD